jgi:hypothetical protein
VVKVVSTWGNQKAKSGGMGRVFRSLIQIPKIANFIFFDGRQTEIG